MMIVALEEEQRGRQEPPRYVVLREISGTEELAELSPADLARRLIVGGTVANGELNFSEQDQVLAEIYRSIYGDHVACRTVCGACDREFEVSFVLNDWISSLHQVDGPIAARGPDRVYELAADGEFGALRFRLPTEKTLGSVAGWEPAATAAALRQTSVVEGDLDDPRLERAMARVGPLLDDEIDTECAYCGKPQAIAFRIADFLCATLARERPLALREVHYLARAYHWSRDDILALSRTARREHVALVLAESRVSESSWA